ncbi:hypothetical protein NXS19_011648 [Fusarium pseudograminearum]|nr:hypothetical protein FPSE5266_01549 [Fusarium pseudograminearum]UZP43836.1 hypothetical protein NXS19_011648 [Fusarium pseudograminearum]
MRPATFPASSQNFLNSAAALSFYRHPALTAHKPLQTLLVTTDCTTQAKMSDSTVARPPPSAISRPLSESLLNEKWDRCLSNLLVKSSLGLGFGVVFSVLLFKRRAWPAFVGVGFGAGRAYEECNFSLKQAARDLKKQTA